MEYDNRPVERVKPFSRAYFFDLQLCDNGFNFTADLDKITMQ